MEMTVPIGDFVEVHMPMRMFLLSVSARMVMQVTMHDQTAWPAEQRGSAEEEQQRATAHLRRSFERGRNDVAHETTDTCEQRQAEPMRHTETKPRRDRTRTLTRAK